MTKIALGNHGGHALFLLAVVGLSCTDAAGGPSTLAEFCSKKAEAECSGVGSKCVATPSVCKMVRVATCEAFAMDQQSMPSPTARPFRPDLAQDCINKTAEVYKKPTITPADRLPMDTACKRVFSGKKKDGDTCMSDYECDAPFNCDLGFGLCAKSMSVGAGEFCNNPGDTCPATEYCNTANPRDCIARPGLGMPCNPPAIPCPDTLRCMNSVCAERVGIGLSCSQDSDCKADVPYCDPFNGNICVAGFTPSTGVAECVQGFGGVPSGGGTGGTTGGGTGGATAGVGGAGGN